MSEDLKKENSSSEELDLIQIFNFIGNGFKKLFLAIGSLFQWLFHGLILLIKTILQYFKIIFVVLIISFVIGYALEKVKSPLYKSEMLVKPYFDSKYQLVSNINYYNALIDDKNYIKLSEIFEIDEEDAKMLANFEIDPGPETRNDQIKEYDVFIKSIDSLRAQEISFENFVDNKDLYNAEIFLVEVSSFKKDIFQNLESGFYETFKNEYTIETKKRRDSMLQAKRDDYIKSLEDIDSLQKVYVDVLKEESKNNLGALKISEGLVPLQQEKSKTREFDLFYQRLQIRDSIQAIDRKKIEENVYFDIVSGFQSVGTKNKEFKNKYSILFPIASFLLLCLIFVVFKTVKYVRSYEA